MFRKIVTFGDSFAWNYEGGGSPILFTSIPNQIIGTAGGSSPTGSYQYTGDIGQIFIYDAVLTPTQILQNYNATRATYGL